MKILLVNSFYFMHGGVETHLFQLADLLVKKGRHTVIFFCMKHQKNFKSAYERYFVSYQPRAEELTLAGKLHAACRLIYSFEAKKKIRELLQNERPDIVHLHNFERFISPSIISEIKRHNIPIVMTLHDYRVVCPASALFLRGGNCQRCEMKRFYNVVLNRCIANSYSKSFIVLLGMVVHHVLLRTFDKVDLFICPSLFVSKQLTAMGFQKNMIVLPHVIDVNDYVPCFVSHNNIIVYFGRLTEEKGLFSLLDAVKGLRVQLNIFGDGPLRNALLIKKESEHIDNVAFMGHVDQTQLKEEISKALFTVSPSLCKESFGYSIIESFCLGKAVIASRTGSFKELVADHHTGLLFEPGNVDDLRNKIRTLADDSDLVVRLGKNARAWAEDKLNAESFYRALISHYENLVKAR